MYEISRNIIICHHCDVGKYRLPFGLALHVSSCTEAAKHFLSTWLVILESFDAQHSYTYLILL